MKCVLLGLFLLMAIPVSEALASDRIWSAVVLATREDPPQPVPSKLEEFDSSLRQVFGYNSFYLLGDKTRDITTGESEWLVPSKRIFMKVAILETKMAAYRMRIDLYDGKELLVTTEAKLARDAPLYIRGPQWGKGQIIAILEVR